MRTYITNTLVICAYLFFLVTPSILNYFFTDYSLYIWSYADSLCFYGISSILCIMFSTLVHVKTYPGSWHRESIFEMWFNNLDTLSSKGMFLYTSFIMLIGIVLSTTYSLLPTPTYISILVPTIGGVIPLLTVRFFVWK